MDIAEAPKSELDRLFWELITTSRDAREQVAKAQTATTARDDSIHRAWAEGISARAIAHATHLSHARIQQIVYDCDDRAQGAIGSPPALQSRKQDRERSRMLLTHLAAQQDNVLAGIRERVEKGESEEALSAVVGVARDFALSWNDIADALVTTERDARERFGRLDQLPTR